MKAWLKGTMAAAVGVWGLAAVAVQAEEMVRIGVAGPFSGAYAAFGEQQWRGAEAAIVDINRGGGILGKQILLIKGDDACEPKQAMAVANRLVDNDEVQAVVGHFCSSTTMPASEVYDEAGILVMTHGSTNPMVTERGLKTVLRMCGRDDQQGTVGAEFVVKRLGAKRVAVLHDKDTYGQGLADAMKAHLHTLGLTEVMYEGLTRGEKDFNALVTKIKAAKADAVYFGGLHSEAGPLVRQMREQGVDVPLVSGDGIVSEEFVTAAGGGRFVKNVYMTFGADPRKSPEGKALVARFREAGYEPEGYTLYAYAVVQSIAAAMQESGSYNGVELANWLKRHSVETVMGPKSWDAKGDLKVSDYVMYQWDENGKYAEVE
ncbi:amino acid/amide ABC transporter substrate-binding protein, HAAT family [Magnetococcus marinus MC-1]|uniref:Amino acid/amide ABC transporter substrate-binding protein, HAAT family n=1 Tax=Magnetococcus marinus (strain ATCC BAA-1437 / JCM 17883 / MC-1) TaxID=156889 RepID=A0L4W8_MAGMM|nr:branched-chain amino acid ABC transporter substrate-binding protein [Magnetococcus marinus]ABK43011.1 amino acid/amide ABC transporter substrate-binding protein, HAAT family [Magnetococcus marinus MC-1]